MFTWILTSVLLMLNLCLWIGNICNGLLLGNASIARGLTCCKKLARHEASRKSWSTKFPLGGEVNHIWPLAYVVYAWMVVLLTEEFHTTHTHTHAHTCTRKYCISKLDFRKLFNRQQIWTKQTISNIQASQSGMRYLPKHDEFDFRLSSWEYFAVFITKICVL